MNGRRIWNGQFDLIYKQRTGHCYLCDQDDSRVLLAIGYSGDQFHTNDPGAEEKVAKGPIPRGVWSMAMAGTHPTLGPVCIRLSPKEVPSLRASGRSGFLIHGDNSRRDFTASQGCIILPRPAREAIRALGCKVLTVM